MEVEKSRESREYTEYCMYVYIEICPERKERHQETPMK